MFAGARAVGEACNLYTKLRQRHTGFPGPGSGPCRRLERTVEDRSAQGLALAPDKEIDSCHRSPVLDLDLDLPESRFLLSAGAFGQIGLYDLCAQDRRGWCGPGRGDGGVRVEPLRVFHHLGPREAVLPTVTRAQWYPFDSGMFFSATVDGRVTLWQPESAESVFSWSLDGVAVNDLHISPIAAHCLVAAASGSTVRLCDLRTQTSTHQLRGHADVLMAVRWSPANEFVLASGSRDQTVRLWDIRRPLPLLLFDQDNNRPSVAADQASSGAWTPRSSGSNRESSASPVFFSHPASLNHIEFVPDGEFLVSSDTAGQICRWDARSGRNTFVHYPRMEMLLRQPKHPLSVRRRFAISACGRYLFMPNADQIHVLRTLTGQCIKTLGGHLRSVRCVAASRRVLPELYSGASDRSILVWSPAPRRSPPPPRIGGRDSRRRRGRAAAAAAERPRQAPMAAALPRRAASSSSSSSSSSSEMSDDDEEGNDGGGSGGGGNADDDDAVWQEDE